MFEKKTELAKMDNVYMKNIFVTMRFIVLIDQMKIVKYHQHTLINIKSVRKTLKKI